MKPLDFHTLLGTVKYTLHRRRTGGRWSYYFRWENKRYRDSTRSTEFVDAKEITERAIERILNTSRAGSRGPFTLEKAIELRLAADWPTDDQRRGNESYKSARRRLNEFAAGREQLDLAAQSQLSLTGIIQQYLNDRKNAGYAPASVDSDQRVISRLFSWLMEPPAKLTWPSNPAARTHISIDPVETFIKPPADDAIAKKLTKLAKNDTVYPALILMQNAFRPVGCTRVKWNDIKTGSIPHVAVFEKRKTRKIPLSPWAVRELLAFKKRFPPASPDQAVFPYGINTLHIRLRRLRERNNLPDSETAGSFRRLSYLRLYEAGVDPQRAAKIMGNSVATAMKYYVDLANLTDKDAAAALSPEFVHKTSTKKRSPISAHSRKSRR